ncbi:MAG: TIGR03792 family protein [Ilumatobacteraceae bacterium]|jgi:uncharacterized protein (TIGR03792 family)
MPAEFRYTSNERLPVEVLMFRVAPEHLDEFLRVDHEVFTLGEAFLDGFDRIPFRYKEVWLDDSDPGVVTLVFVWDDLDEWHRVGAPEVQQRLQAEFDARFAHPVELVRAWHEESAFGLHRWSRFERVEPDAASGGAD